MRQRSNDHIIYYISLSVILGFGLLITIAVSNHTRLQMLSIFLTAFFYIIWGILHHLINHDLTAKIVVEYILIGSFGVTVVFFLLKGGLF